MGTTLTNTQPKDTYKSLLKTSDSSELSGTAKVISDGNGNDSALAVSTSQVRVGGGSTASNFPLTIRSGSAGYDKIMDWGTDVGGSWGSMFINTVAPYETILNGGSLAFNTGGTERARITPNGLTFNGDTAAANALDDYEEGTFTPTAAPNTSGTITLNSGFNTWSYTKIGRKVTITGLALVSSVSSPVGQILVISGLPFSTGLGNQFRSSFSAGYLDASASYAGTALASYIEPNSSTLKLKIDCSTIATNDEIHICATYFV